MRWDNLLAGQEETETAVLPLFAGEAVVRNGRHTRWEEEEVVRQTGQER